MTTFKFLLFYLLTFLKITITVHILSTIKPSINNYFLNIPPCLLLSTIYTYTNQSFYEYIDFPFYIAIITTTWITHKEKRKSYLLTLVFTIIMTSSLDDCVSNILHLNNINSLNKHILISIISVLILLVINLIQNILKKNKLMEQFYSQYINLSMTIIVLLSLGLSVPKIENQFASLKQQSNIPVSISNVIIIISFDVFLLCLIINRSLANIRRITFLYKNEKLLNHAQQSYYKALLKREEDTRKYRHDMTNHYICIEDAINCNDYERAKLYLQNMHKDFNNLSQNIVFSGNFVIDSITSYYILGLNENIKKTVTGKITCELALSDTQLCSIYANLIVNAIEELNRIKSNALWTNKLWLKIEFSQGKRYARIIISNTTDKKAIQQSTKIVSSKGDSKDHGLGLINTQNIIHAIGGNIESVISDNMYIVTIHLPLL